LQVLFFIFHQLRLASRLSISPTHFTRINTVD